MKKLLSIIFLSVFTALPAHTQPIFGNEIKPLVIVDVRTPAEFAAGHLSGAINIPLDRIGTDIRTIKHLDQQSPILLYCCSGHRSAQAREILVQRGFRKVTDGGSMAALSKRLKTCNNKQPADVHPPA